MENLVVSIFKTESEAYQAFAELKTFKQTEKTKVAQIAVIKNEGGHITDKDRFDFEDSANDGALKGGLIGAFVGLLAGPLGVLFGYGIGSLYGLAGGDTVEAVQEGLIDQELAKRPYIAGDEYTIADIAIWSWYGRLVQGHLYQNSAEFLDAQSYKHLNEWADRIAKRPAVQKGVEAEYKLIK